MNVTTYVFFNGTCEEAFGFYAKTFGAKIEALGRYGGSPGADKVPAGMQDKIIHGRLVVGETTIMASDSPSYAKPQGYSLSLDVGSEAEAERVFQALAGGGEVRMPLQQTFFAKRFGMVTDRFGIPWMVTAGTA